MTRTRFAPSPTGSLHVGNARAAVLNWLFARHAGGDFVLRIEDTDVERTVAGSEAEILEDLRWLGLDWTEGPGAAAGAHGPYRQSERLPIYHEHVDRLLASADAYRCFCTEAELEARRGAAIERGASAHYDRTCRCLTPVEIAERERSGLTASVRFRTPDEGSVVFEDVVRGAIEVPAADVGDFIILRSDGLPTYNFAVVVDDALMEITHVIRGSGHLSNTPRQVLLYHALGYRLPAFVHVPQVLGPDRQKLSKRHGAKALSEYRREGYLPDALVNYLSLLSWSSPTGDEVLSRERLIEEISLDRIGAADVVFDPAKLLWICSKHIERMPLDELVRAVEPFIDRERHRIPSDRLQAAVEAVRTHLSTLAQINALLGPFDADAAPRHGAAWAASAGPESHAVLAAVLRALEPVDPWEPEAIDAAARAAGREAGARGRALFEPLRRALTGDEHGPPLVAVLYVLGRDTTLATLRRALGGEPEEAPR